MATLNKKKRFNLGTLTKKSSDQLAKVPLTKFLYSSVFISILTIILGLLVQNNLPPQIPLYYGLAAGEEQLASPIMILIPSILALGVTVFNILIILKLKNDLMQKSLVVTSFAISVFAMVTTVKIVLLVGSF